MSELPRVTDRALFVSPVPGGVEFEHLRIDVARDGELQVADAGRAVGECERELAGLAGRGGDRTLGGGVVKHVDVDERHVAGPVEVADVTGRRTTSRPARSPELKVSQLIVTDDPLTSAAGAAARLRISRSG